MPFPPGFPTVTVTKDYRVAIGDPPLNAIVTFTPSARLVNIAPNLTVEPVEVKVVIPANGLLSVVLAATSGFSYLVTERVNGKQRAPFSVLLPAGTSPVVLDSLAPIEPVIPQYTPVRTVEGIGPDPTGNIDLPPSAGSDPAGTAAGLVAVHEAAPDPHPQYLTPAEGDVVYASLASLVGKENVGVAVAADAAHVAAGDPHGQYLTSAEGNAAYSALVHAHVLGDVTGLVAALAAKANRPVTRRAVITNPTDATLPNTGASWAAVPGFELTLPAAVGDDVELVFGAMRSATASAFLDIAVIVGTELRRFGANNTAVAASEGNPDFYHTGTFVVHAAPFGFTVEAGDLDGANIRFVVACKGNGTGLLYSSTAYPFRWRAINRGVCG